MRRTLENIQRSNNSNARDLRRQNEEHSSNRNNNGVRTFWNNNNERVERNKRLPMTCFECGQPGHMKFNCPKVSGERTKAGKYTVNTSSNLGAGLFVDAKINNVEASCLIDTGATLSVISSEFLKKHQCSLVLETFQKEIITASGSPLEIMGRTKISIEINGKVSSANVIVAKIEGDAILGIDFMKTQNIIVDVGNNQIFIDGKSVQLNCTGPIGCYRVVVADRVEIPARTEMVIQGKVVDPIISKGLYVTEPNEKFLLSNKGIVARALVSANERIPLRIMNPLTETQILYPGTNISTLSPVENIQPVNLNSKKIDNIPSHLQDLYKRTTDGMNKEQSKEVAKLLQRYEHIFSESDFDIGRTGIIRHQIDTGNARPIKQPLRRLPEHMSKEVSTQIKEMLDKGVIHPSSSPWSSGVVMVKKKDGSHRFCIDYRKLNEVTIKDAYPLPRIDESLDQLAGSSWFSCLDLNAGYWQVEVEPKDRSKTAFVTRDGLFEFEVLPFGLCNGPATFERLMETVLAGLHWQICLIYLDDIIVTGNSFENMIENLDSVFQRLEKAGLKLKPKKCHLFAKQVEFLGHIISKDGIMTDPKKTECIKNWPEPRNVKEIRSFLGLCSYYRKFIFEFSEIAKPLHTLTEKNKTFQWTDKCQEAFSKLKEKLTSAPILAHPDFSKPFILDCDASNFAISGILSQEIDGQERVVVYASRTLSKSERKYCVTRKELLALVHFVKYFRHYLYGKPFTVRTDHSSLRWLMNFKNPEGQIARWIEILSSYSMVIKHRPGRLHTNADAISRIPCRQCKKSKTILTSMKIR